MSVKRVDGETVWLIREDQSSGTCTLDRLLATDGNGEGLYYRFHGWKPRPRGYHTELRIVAVSAESGRCRFVLPEWDPNTEIEEALAALPPALRAPGAVGSCMANLASPSAAGLAIHGYRLSEPRGISRRAAPAHPEVLAEGQRYRCLRRGREIVLLEVQQPRARAWNGQRIVRVECERLLAVDEDGRGRFYEYVGGGVWATRRNRAALATGAA